MAPDLAHELIPVVPPRRPLLNYAKTDFTIVLLPEHDPHSVFAIDCLCRLPKSLLTQNCFGARGSFA